MLTAGDAVDDARLKCSICPPLVIAAPSPSLESIADKADVVAAAGDEIWQAFAAPAPTKSELLKSVPSASSHKHALLLHRQSPAAVKNTSPGNSALQPKTLQQTHTATALHLACKQQEALR